MSACVYALMIHISVEPRETVPNSLDFGALATQGVLIIVHPYEII